VVERICLRREPVQRIVRHRRGVAVGVSDADRVADRVVNRGSEAAKRVLHDGLAIQGVEGVACAVAHRIDLGDHVAIGVVDGGGDAAAGVLAAHLAIERVVGHGRCLARGVDGSHDVAGR
jgi:hypothetical protein